MLISGVDISSLGVKLYDRVISSNQVDTTQEWLDGDIQPTYVRQQDRFKNIKLSFLVLGADEDDAFLKISKLTQLLKKATLIFDDISYSFDVTLRGQAKTDRLKNGNFIAHYTLDSDYAKGEREIYTTDATATSLFKLNVLYYQNQTTLLGADVISIRAGAFNGETDTLASIGIDVDKYKPEHYLSGTPTNLGRMLLTYENLQSLNTLIINYAPYKYNLTVSYWLDNGTGYTPTMEYQISFTYPQLQSVNSIGQIIDAASYKPDGYRATIDYHGDLTVEDILAASPINVRFDRVENELSKNITIIYRNENDEGTYDIINNRIVNIQETNIIPGMTLADIIRPNIYNPNELYYQDGAIQDHRLDELVTYNSIETSYTVNYRRKDNTIYVEYYAGTYPDWYRLSTIPVHLKYMDSYETDFDLEDLDIDLNRYHTSEYHDGVLYNSELLTDYDSIINTGVLRVYYVPIDYSLSVRYYTDETTYTEETVTVNALQFLSNPVLGDIVNIRQHCPEGYQFDPANSYGGEVTLSALLVSSPLTISYEEITINRIKNVIVKYRVQLASNYSTLNTSILSINEADTIGGVRLRDLININRYKPEYYDNGIINGASANALLEFDEIAPNYEVIYNATSYTTPVYYYTDDVDELNWVGSSVITYTVNDFTAETTLYDLGLDLNLYKSVYTGNGEIQYTGPINFSALRALQSVDILYMTQVEPDDPTGIDYPHRVLFLQHNDLGSYENLHPEWTMNHAYINTGVSAMDMSQLTVIMECRRVDELVPLYTVNDGYAYLFGSSSPLGQFYMRYNNQTMYSNGNTGVNLYEAKVGNTSNPLILTEENAIGWSENSGIYAAPQLEGYSNATFTYTSRVPAEHAQMPNPIYLFANNNNGQYADGLAGIGITGCKIYIGNQLVRDFIPVQFYDKIGSQIAPSNCLYDKVTQTFFEDATGLNSFNIIDDDRYEDLNPAHQIGSCYVNYCRDGAIYNTAQLFFRGDDFDEEFDLYNFLMIDYYQPPYHKAGVIVNISSIAAVNFDNLNGFVFTVNYEALTNLFEVNYYKDSIDPNNLIVTETIGLQESDFYQVPSFGDIVRLNKYRPEGYKTDFVYPGAKVSLQRMMDNAPYNIVYTPITETEETYTTTIRYIKKVWGIRTYETIGTLPLTLTESQFRDGEYIEYFIDYNYMKPQDYYKDGVPYEWYEHDYRLDTPDNLRNEYIICYMPEPQNIEVRYYTDDIDEANLVATTNWTITVDEFDGPFYLVDQLPNSFINKFKPVTADGGLLQNTDVLYTFDDLISLGHIDILYMSMAEPDDPTNEAHIDKVLYWTSQDASSRMMHFVSNGKGPGYYMVNGGAIPYIDLGYTPKEIGRLKVELKGYFQGNGYNANTTPYGYQAPDYTYSFGYYGALGAPTLNHHQAEIQTLYVNNDIRYQDINNIPKESKASRGCFAIRGHIPQATFGTYTDVGPTGIDGERWYNTNNNGSQIVVTDNFDGQPKYAKMYGIYRKGFAEGEDDNYNTYIAYKTYGYERSVAYSNYVSNYAETNDTSDNKALSNKWLADPITYTLDAYHSYASAYDWGNSNLLTYTNFDESQDTDTFEGRCKPVGSLTLFRTRNPDTGKMNIMPFNPITYPSVNGGIGMVGFTQAEIQTFINPFAADYTGYVTREAWTIVHNGANNPNDELSNEEGLQHIAGSLYKKTTYTINVAYSDWPCPVYPQNYMGAIWGIKIWDQDKLVRDMIPVKAGEKIYDYVMPADGLFDLVTEIFFGNSNEGGTYQEKYYLSNRAGQGQYVSETITILPSDVIPLHVVDDPCYYGKITENYYDENNHFIANQYVAVPTWFYPGNSTLADELQYNDYKPDSYHLDGMLDTDDPDDGHDNWTLQDIYEQGLINIYYKLRTYAKSVLYYKDDFRIGTQDLYFSLADIQNANSLAQLNISPNLFSDPQFKPGRLVFDESILQNNDVAGFIDAPSPVVVYDKFTKAERPDLLYLEYYRGGAYDDPLAPIELDENNNNYLICNLTAKVLNPNGTIKYREHYHSAMYENEEFDYFIPYQVRVINPYTGIHYGPARKYKTLAQITTSDIYTIDEVRNGWGRLHEYYHGWIDLSGTEPVAGPGQNPDYDQPGDETATIPFGEEILITKLTVDRLWAWVPAEESWVKAEEISYNQAGKLYNALDIAVVDLENDVDWDNASSLSDIGINPNAKRLQYHTLSDYTYDGAYTQEAFSDIHELDFVYPETVYNYICIYYKNHRTNENELGRSAFSCTISDWNPDWDHFIETSWRYDENDNLILPELYRGSPISLSWDYFGLDKNLYKPTGFSDGIYLWNPHPWDEEHLFFSFEELVRVGAQYVIYPFMDPHTFKYWAGGTTDAEYFNNSAYATDTTRYLDYVVETEDPMLNTTNNLYKNYTECKFDSPGYNTQAETNFWSQDDYELIHEGKFNPLNRYLSYYGQYISSNSGFWEGAIEDYYDKHPSLESHYTWQTQILPAVQKVYNANLQGLFNYEQDAYHRFYISGTQPYSSHFVATIPYHNNTEPMYALHTLLPENPTQADRDAYSELPSGWIRIYPNHSSFYNIRSNNDNINYGVIPNVGSGLYHGIRTYTNYVLQNYFIPVPKGMWYEWDGEEKQMPKNGLFDLLTGDMISKTQWSEIFEYDYRTRPGDIPSEDVYSVFTGWNFQITNLARAWIGIAQKQLTSYQAPDLLSTPKHTIRNGLYIPTLRRTQDVNNRVDGTWYDTGDGWVKTSLDENETGSRISWSNSLIPVQHKQYFTVMKDYTIEGTSYTHKYLAPPTAAVTLSQMSNGSEIITTYWDLTIDGITYLFDGEYWYNEEETSLNINSDFDILALAVDTLDYYEYPIADEQYRLGQYLAGDRIFVNGYSARDPNWAISDEGWFRIDDNFTATEQE